jgi:CRISPR-associated protein (TIGR02710 family)
MDDVQKNTEFLRQLNEEKGETQHRLDLLDLVANAQRRADLASRYDDAVARLYSALESIARYRLLDGYKINASKAQPDQVPESLRADFVRRLMEPNPATAQPDQVPESSSAESAQRLGETGAPLPTLHIGLQDSYRLLSALGDPAGERYMRREKELSRILKARNSSRLAHGTEPIKPETYQQLLEIILSFAQIAPADLPAFPYLEL